MIYGYARVSSTTQNLDTQVAQLTAYGCEKIFRAVQFTTLVR